jgi:hypothetical protein
LAWLESLPDHFSGIDQTSPKSPAAAVHFAWPEGDTENCDRVASLNQNLKSMPSLHSDIHDVES